jgi:hypothetical protein
MEHVEISFLCKVPCRILPISSNWLLTSLPLTTIKSPKTTICKNNPMSITLCPKSSHLLLWIFARIASAQGLHEEAEDVDAN